MNGNGFTLGSLRQKIKAFSAESRGGKHRRNCESVIERASTLDISGSSPEKKFSAAFPFFGP